MARVTVEDCVDKVPNRFELVMLAAHRAREISAGSPPTVDRDNDKNPVVSLREIAEETQAAQDLRDGSEFSPADASRRIGAQLDTLIDHDVRHAVLGASGCGAFNNPGSLVAQVYREETLKRGGHFDVLAFAIFDAGYGPGNFAPFKAILGSGVPLG